jgi:hypothetical protein
MKDPFNDLVHPSKSPRFIKSDKLDVSDIKGAVSTTNKLQKSFGVRDHINISDIMEE